MAGLLGRATRGLVTGVFVLLWATHGHAQVTTADVVGRVTDTSGGALPGVTVTINNPSTGDVRTLVTNETGEYVINLLPIGSYTVKFELEGFTPSALSLRLSAGDRQRADVQLSVGSAG